MQSPHPSSEFQTHKRLKVSERRQNHSSSSSQRISGLNGITEALLGLWERTLPGIWECEGSARRAQNTAEYTESAFHPSGLSIATCSSDWGLISICANWSKFLASRLTYLVEEVHGHCCRLSSSLFSSSYPPKEYSQALNTQDAGVFIGYKISATDGLI